MAKRVNKYNYLVVIQCNIGYGWEDVCEYPQEERKQAYADIKEYRQDGYGIPYRVIDRREPNPEFNI